MRSKRATTINSKKKKTTRKKSNQMNRLEEILDTETRSRTSQEQLNQSSSSSSSATQSSITTSNDGTLDNEQDSNFEQVASRKPQSKSEVWDYAVKLNNGKAKCKKCHREISCTDHSTSGLRRHLLSCQKI